MIVCAALVALSLCAFARVGLAQTTAPAGRAVLITGGVDEKTGNIRLLVNKSVTITTSRPYKRISVGQPDIAEVNGIGPTRILVTGKKAGATQIIVWDEDDNSQTVDVLVQANLLALRSLYERLLPGSNIDVVDNEGMIALTGRVPTVNAADQAVAMANGYGNRVLNLLEVSGGQQVMLQVRFAEVSRTATSALGVNFSWFDPNGRFINNTGQIGPFGLKSADNGGLINLTAPESFASANYFGLATFGENTIATFVQALRENNLLRVLAEPNLTAISGQEADFLAGGEFPVPIVESAGGNSAVTVNMIKFGVMLRFTPVALGDGKIRLMLNPEVSDVDFTNAPTLNGFRVPGRKIRQLSTTVELQDGQTLALAGLLDNRVAANKQVTPLLGDVPILGPLFRSVRYQRSETELVVLCTPRLVHGLNPGEVPMLPGENWRHPTEGDLYLNGDIGGPEDDAKLMKTPTRRFIGTYGFVPAPQDVK
jgi:pilus assembly protein CpaC